jgi:glutathione synthase/RimK-type ligase-like ATP-grasp enzyme
VRRAGTHGGNDFELIGDAAALAQFIGGKIAADYYVSDYIDYQSADGYYRKYRAIFVGDKTVPYHLAIGSHWKVHHFRTDMAAQPWMQLEEEAFLGTPNAVLTPQHRATLAAIQKILGLEYCGVDFAIDRTGALVVFEANAAMLVQPDDSKFGYKAGVNDTVKAAFTAVLARAAAQRTRD